MSLSLSLSLYIYIYIYTWFPANPQAFALHATVSFHNLESQNFKLSVSNPKSKCVACFSVLSPISNCQGLGHKNKHDILKTDRKFGCSWYV